MNTTTTQNTTNISSNLTKITQNDADIANNSSAISANATKITKNKNDIAVVKTLASVAPTLTLSKGVKKGKKERKAGVSNAHGNNNVLTSVIVPKTGKFLVSFRVIIQPNGMTVSGFKSSTWYDTRNVPAGNQKLKSWLYNGNSKVSGTEFVTDGDTYAKSLPHHIFYEDVMDLTKTLLVSSRYAMASVTSTVYCISFDAQISLLAF